MIKEASAQDTTAQNTAAPSARLCKKKRIRKRYGRLQLLSGCVFFICILALLGMGMAGIASNHRHRAQEEEIRETKDEAVWQNRGFGMPAAGAAAVFQEKSGNADNGRRGLLPYI